MGTLWPATSMRALIAGCAVAASVWARCPWPGTAGLALLGGIAVAADVPWLKLPGHVWKSALAIACGLSLLVPLSPWLATGNHFTLDEYARYYQAVLAWLVAVSIVPVGLSARNRGRFRLGAMICALIGGTLWLAGAWSQNLRVVFYLGLLVNLALLILCKLWFRLPGPVILVVNTLLLLILVLGVADLFVPAPPRLEPHLGVGRNYYSYEHARRDPRAFARWWNYFLEQWLQMSKEIIVPDRRHYPHFYLRPGGHSRLFDCPISINSLGFRGREITREKGKAYRIVALGASTTFGCTLGPNDQPWPELLEQMIRERLKPRRPVEVINAGVPGYTLEDNLARLGRDILPLKPDMIISYHGFNGFLLLDESLPSVCGAAPPVYRPRPLRLLANCEYGLKLLWYRRRFSPGTASHPRPADLMDTKYARAYRELSRIARTNRIHLVLANFSMAANSQSDPDVVDFYRSGFPLVKWQIDANQLHSQLVQEIARRNQDVCLVDVQPNLDGAHENFVDLVHLTQDGRQQLAQALFAGIRRVLEAELSPADQTASAP